MTTAWDITGRSGEGAATTLERTDWDIEYLCLILEVAQSKVSEFKYAAIVSGYDRLSDWFTNFGDTLAVGERHVYNPAVDTTSWLLPRYVA